MRILGIADAWSPHTHKWAAGLLDRGHEVTLVSWRPGGGRPAGLPARVNLVDWFLPNFHVRRPWVTLLALARLRREYRRLEPHIVQVHFLGHGAWYAALTGCRPLVLWVMGGDIEPLRWVPGSRQEAWLSPFALRRADAVLAWSDALLSTVKPYIRKNAPRAVINGGVDLERFSTSLDRVVARRTLGLSAEGFVVFSPRLLWPRHHADSIVAAFARFAASHENARLLLVWYRAEHYPAFAERVRSAINRSGVADRISIVEEIPHSEMQTYYAAADCTISLSDMDGTPMTVQESLACGTPAIIFDLPEYDPAVYRDGETVLRIPPQDANAISSAFLRLAMDSDLRTRMAGLGRQTVIAHASIREQMDRLERIYLDLAGL